LRYFLNTLFSFRFLTVKFWIWNTYTTYKIIQKFNLLSGLQACISNVIFEGERSFKPPSTTSWLILVRSPSFLHHHHLALAATIRAQLHATTRIRTREDAVAAPPLSKGIWAGLFLLDEGIWGGDTRGGTQKVGGPLSTLRNMSHDFFVVRVHLNLPLTTHDSLETSPSPLLRDVGSNIPLSRAMWAANPHRNTAMTTQ